LSGAQSCWFRPSGNFFELAFLDDGDPDSLPNGTGWDMLLNIDGFATPQSFRGPNDVFGATPIEAMYGNELGTSPLVIRFQGARALGVLPDPCNVTLAGIDSEIFPGSLTGWVENPADLNDFFGNNPVLRPNIIRFAVIWDFDAMNYGDILGIESIQIAAQPD